MYIGKQCTASRVHTYSCILVSLTLWYDDGAFPLTSHMYNKFKTLPLQHPCISIVATIARLSGQAYVTKH